MNVGFIAPLSIAAVHGGVRTQALQTARHLRQFGVNVEFVSPWQAQLNYDLVHVFSAVPGTLDITKKFSDMGTKVVLSSILYSNRSHGIISASLTAERFLSVLGSGIQSGFGIKADICSYADVILPNTQSEALLIQNGFGIEKQKITVVPNGVEISFTKAFPELFTNQYGIDNFVLFAGQAGAARKNVLSLLKASPQIEREIVIIGDFYEDEYGAECLKLIRQSDKITHIGTLSHDSEILKSAYAACHTFVLPSQFETPGIGAMEAALAGANIAITDKGGTKEYFQDHAEYLSPDSLSSIVSIVNRSLQKEKTEVLKKHILENYTWEKVASKTFEIYKKLLN